MINDCHVHFGPSGTINQSVQTLEDLALYRVRMDIDSLVVMPFDVKTDVWNKQIAELGRSWKWIKPFYWITSHKAEQVPDSGFSGFKFHGAYLKAPCSSPLFESVMCKIAGTGKPLLVHCGRYLEASTKSNTSYLHALELAARHPRMPVILGHMGGTDTTIVRHALEEGRPLRNVYFDTSGITTPYIVEYAVKLGLADRIMFGSDHPWCSARGQLHNVLDAQISKNDKAKILHGNFKRLIK